MKKIIMFISVIILALCFFKTSLCQSKTHWHWIERDTVFNLTGIQNIPPRSCVKFIDIDQDLKVDLVIGMENDLRLYRNSGSIYRPAWKQVPDYFKDVSDWMTQGFDFEDIDEDGRLEFITTWFQDPVFWENLGTIENPNWRLDSLIYRYQLIPEFENSLLEFPEFVDFDKDDDFDFAAVRYNYFDVPELVYYENIASNEYPIWQMDSLFFSGCDRHYGMLAPTFVDIDNDGDFDLFYKSNIEGTSFIECYENAGNQDTIQWKEFNFSKPRDSFASYGVYDFDWFDFDLDNDLDLIISNGTRSLLYFKNTGNSYQPNFNEYADVWAEIDIGKQSCVFVHDFDGDLCYDLAIFGYRPSFIDDIILNRSFKNVHGNIPIKQRWQEVNWLNLNYFIDSGTFDVNYLTISPLDFDQDNYIDIAIFVATYSESPTLFNCFLLHNRGDNTNFDLEINNEYLDTLKNFTKDLRPVFGDLDGDGDMDMMGIDSGKVHFYENIGTKDKYSIREKPVWASGDTIDLYGRSQFVDIDFDEDFDLVLGLADGSLMGYFNEGSKQQPFWRKDTTVFAGVQTDQWSSPFLIDFDHDGDLDLISGNGWGGVHYFENQSFLPVEEPQVKNELDFQLYQNYPNPFNADTRILYQIGGSETLVRIEIFNILGASIKTLVNKIQPAGNYSEIWNGTDENGCAVSGGIYFCKLKAKNFTDTQKLLLIR